MLRLTDFACPEEIDALIQSRVLHTKTAASTKVALDAVKKRFIYEKRRKSHAYKTRDPRFDLAEFDALLWRFYLHSQIEQGRTTGDIAEEMGLDLETLNKRI